MSADIGKPFILFLAKAKANCKIYWNEITFSTWCFTWSSFLQSLRCKIRYSQSANSASVPIFHSPSPEFAWNVKCKMWNRASRMIKTSLKYKQDEKKNRSWLSSVQSKAWLCAPSWHAYKYKKIQTQKNTNTKNTITKTEVGCPRCRVRLGYAPSWHAYKLPLVRC